VQCHRHGVLAEEYIRSSRRENSMTFERMSK
jgi:hypothetical protein